MKRSEFIAGFEHSRRVAYAKAVRSGHMRPSEAAMGLGDAKRDALTHWRRLTALEKSLAPAAFFEDLKEPDPGRPADWRPAEPIDDGVTAELRRDLARRSAGFHRPNCNSQRFD